MTATSNVGDLTEGGTTLLGGTNVMSSGSIKIAGNVSREHPGMPEMWMVCGSPGF